MKDEQQAKRPNRFSISFMGSRTPSTEYRTTCIRRSGQWSVEVRGSRAQGQLSHRTNLEQLLFSDSVRFSSIRLEIVSFPFRSHVSAGVGGTQLSGCHWDMDVYLSVDIHRSFLFSAQSVWRWIGPHLGQSRSTSTACGSLALKCLEETTRPRSIPNWTAYSLGVLYSYDGNSPMCVSPT